MPGCVAGLHPDTPAGTFPLISVALWDNRGALVVYGPGTVRRVCRVGTRAREAARTPNEGSPMKTLRLVSTPTRNRRLNEIIGMIVLVAAGLLLLALASYTPSDPSFNTVGSYLKGRPAHNWTGMVGAYLADATLQLIAATLNLAPVRRGDRIYLMAQHG